MSWICELCDNIKTEGYTLKLTKCEDHSGYTPVNALFKPFDGGILKGKHFFEFRFNECRNGAFIGITDEGNFNPGYRLKGLLYGGNLSDGSRLLVADFGERIVDNDKVAMLIELESKRLKVHFFHNDKPLGLAFYITKLTEKPLFPVIQMFQNTEVSISKRRFFPKDIERPFVRYNGMEGIWQLERCEHKGMLIPQFNLNWKKFTLKVLQDASLKENFDTFHLMFKVENAMFATLENMQGKWHFRPGLSTLISITGDSAEAENFLYNFYGNFQNVELIGQSLVFHANDYQRIIFKRSIVNVPQAVTSNPLK